MMTDIEIAQQCAMKPITEIAVTAHVEAWRKAQSARQAQAEEKGKKRGQGCGFLKGSPHVFHKLKGFVRPFVSHPKSLHKAQAIGGKAHASPVTPKRLGAVQQHGFFQVEKSAAWRGFHPAVQAVEHVKTAAKATPASAAAKGEQRQQAVLATKGLQPEVRLTKVPHAQHKRVVGPLCH